MTDTTTEYAIIEVEMNASDQYDAINIYINRLRPEAQQTFHSVIGEFTDKEQIEEDTIKTALFNAILNEFVVESLEVYIEEHKEELQEIENNDRGEEE